MCYCAAFLLYIILAQQQYNDDDIVVKSYRISRQMLLLHMYELPVFIYYFMYCIAFITIYLENPEPCYTILRVILQKADTQERDTAYVCMQPDTQIPSAQIVWNLHCVWRLRTEKKTLVFNQDRIFSYVSRNVIIFLEDF